jgi:hypothetical protein
MKLRGQIKKRKDYARVAIDLGNSAKNFPQDVDFTARRSSYCQSAMLSIDSVSQPCSKLQTHQEMATMRFIVMIKADKHTEAGEMPSEQLLAEMGKFNEELVKAGVMLAGEGLHPSAKGARVRFSGSQRTVIDGPFTETKELIAGFWLWQVKSLAEAIEWVKRCPNPLQGEAEIEIRQIFEAEDFGAEFTPELRAQEERVRAEIAARNE